MFGTFFRWLFGRNSAARVTVPEAAPIDLLNRQAPLRSAPPSTPAVVPVRLADTYVSREAVLSRQEKIAGYHFMLQDSTRSRIRNDSRRVHHLYAEVLVRSLVNADVGRLLGSRVAFIDIPDSFLDHPSLAQQPAPNTVLVLTQLADAGAPEADALLKSIRRLKAAGYRIGLPDPLSTPEFAELLPEADVIVAKAPLLTAETALTLSARILERAPQATLLVRELPGLEDFRFCFQMGAALFQGPFITSRENWQDRNLGPNVAGLATLLGKLRQGADTDEIVRLLKQDAALPVRLLRYINSAANGLPEHVSSIERAMILLGRDRLYRWILLLMCSADEGGGRASAVLETALVRARMMELLGPERSAAEREALFLTGLLSLIDVVLRVPIERAMTSLAVAPEIESAVLRGEGPHAAALALVKACEHGDPDAVRAAAAACNTTPEAAAQLHLEALAWALSVEPE